MHAIVVEGDTGAGNLVVISILRGRLLAEVHTYWAQNRSWHTPALHTLLFKYPKINILPFASENFQLIALTK